MKTLLLLLIFSMSFTALSGVQAVPDIVLGNYELMSANDLESCEEVVKVTDELAGTKFENSLYFKGIRYKYNDFDFSKINISSVFTSKELNRHTETKASYETFKLEMHQRKCGGFGSKFFKSCFGKKYRLIREINFDYVNDEFTAKRFDFETGEELFNCTYKRVPDIVSNDLVE